MRCAVLCRAVLQVTLDLAGLLAREPYAESAAWVCAWLALAPKYSPGGQAALWNWLSEGRWLTVLVMAAARLARRR